MRAPTTHRTLLAAVALAVPLLAAATAPGAVAAPPFAEPPGASAAGGTVAGAWIVTLADSVDSDTVAAEHGRRYGAQVDHVYRHALRGYAARMSEQAAARVRGDSRVVAVEADAVMSIAAPKPGDAGIAAVEEVPTGLRRIGGPGAAATGPAVAVIDTGSGPHADLNVVGGRNCSTGSSFNDGNGHGTHVAGTIGAKANGVGVVGVVPGVKIYSVRVLNNAGSGSTSTIVCGLDWVSANAASLGIKTVNMSLGGSGTAGSSCAASTYRRAVCDVVNKGVTVVVAAGNSAANATNYVPAAFPEAITVSALADFDGAAGGLGAATCRADVDDTFADFSNFGAPVDIIAPGVCINSTWKGGGYNTISGTSMASPHVAGAAALYLSTNPNATPTTVRAAVLGAATGTWDSTTDPDGSRDPLLQLAGL